MFGISRHIFIACGQKDELSPFPGQWLIRVLSFFSGKKSLIVNPHIIYHVLCTPVKTAVLKSCSVTKTRQHTKTKTERGLEGGRETGKNEGMKKRRSRV